MIEPEELAAIDSQYFEIIGTGDYGITLRSRNTRHEWHLLERIANDHRIFVLSHRHRPSDPYHLQRTKPSVEACCAYINDHDEYYLEKIKKQREQRQRRFEELVAKKLPVTN